ncbi:sodium channel protein Nach-like [Ochlerotatus camptorhynchus]|uniref:sodium channel protein Nach-like n=1 Tax=Ochlerotatus camptorhynchus TaxID=644619 RepID=UPI0031D11A64
MMELSWIRFKSTPTITTIETTTYPIWNVAFPAVTICNINKVDRSRTSSIIEALIRRGMSRQDANDVLISMASLVNFESTNASYENEGMLGGLGYTPAKMLLELNQPCESLIKYCYWLGTEVSCAKFFQTTKTHVGFCCSFNVDKSMYVDNKSPMRSFPPPNIRLSGAGKNVGLSVMVDIAPEKYMAPTKSYYGAEVFVHSPRDFPADSDFEDTLQPGWDVDFCVTPIPIESSDSLKRVPLQQRQCFMPNEGTLQSHNRFSLNLCMSECRLRTIIKLCSCVPFFYADFNISEVEGVSICTLKNVNCLRHFRKYFFSLKPPRELAEEHLNLDLGMDCNCMPSCTFLNYKVQSISSRRFSGPFTSSYFGGRNVSTYATLHVHFKDLYCVKYRREAFMTWDSLLASFGGIFGLCMGGSVLSIVELFYYCAVKPFALYSARRRAGSGNQLRQTRANSSRLFRPSRYPVGFFKRRNVILRERTSGRGKRNIAIVSPQMGFPYGTQNGQTTGDPNSVFLF